MVLTMHDLTAFQRDLLYVVAANDGAKGLEIKADMDAYYSADVNHGRLYPNLDQLTGKGLVEKEPGEDDRSNAYSLTTRGRREIEARREWEAERAPVGVAHV